MFKLQPQQQRMTMAIRMMIQQLLLPKNESIQLIIQPPFSTIVCGKAQSVWKNAEALRSEPTQKGLSAKLIGEFQIFVLVMRYALTKGVKLCYNGLEEAVLVNLKLLNVIINFFKEEFHYGQVCCKRNRNGRKV